MPDKIECLIDSVRSLETTVETLKGSVEGMEKRLSALETIASSVSGFENRFDRIEQRLDKLVDSLSATSQRVSLLNGQIRGEERQSSKTAAYLSAIGALSAALIALITLFLRRLL